MILNNQTAEERDVCAHHEAGHAVLAYRYHRAILRVSINQDGAGLARAMALKANTRDSFGLSLWRRLVWEECQICAAGEVCEMIFSGQADVDACRVDREHVHQWLQELSTVDDATRQQLYTATKLALTEPCTWRAVRAVAERLLDRGAVDGRELADICRSLHVARVPE